MLGLGRNRIARRNDALRENSRAKVAALRHLLLERVGVKSLIVCAALLAGVCVVTFWESEQLPYRAGQYIDRPIVSRVDFERVSQTETLQRQQKARLSTPNYYRSNDALFHLLESEFREMGAQVRAAETFEKFKPADPARFELDAAAFEQVRRLALPESKDAFGKLVQVVLTALRESTLVSPPTESQRTTPHAARHAVLVAAKGENRVPISRVWDANNPQQVEVVANQALAAASVPPPLRGTFRQVIVRAVIAPRDASKPPEPPFVFDRARTEAELARADKLEPVRDVFKRGTVLVSPGELSVEQLVLLAAENERFLAVRRSDPLLRRTWRQDQIGRALLAAFLTISLLAYAWAFQPRVLQIHTRAIGLAALVLGILTANVALFSATSSPLWMMMTVNVSAAVLTLAYNQRFALGVSAIIALLATLVMRESVGLFVCQLAASTSTVVLLAEVRTRLWLVWVGLISGAVTTLAAAAVFLTNTLGMADIAQLAVSAGSAAMLGVFFVLILLPLLERAFRIATALTLLEWADTSRPLLRQLIQKAPGTWQHSHLIANMAEAAADAIRANGLLVRVGAYYHDIGKMIKPEYFVENQLQRPNVHARLAPNMSLLVILGHVKDGLALAREYGLPNVLTRFIAEHHGTTVVRYFHAKAAQQHADTGGDPDDRAVDETAFRYPGPKPSSKESAILMLCDAVEGTVRTLQDPTPTRIETVVHEISMARLMDSQFDDCDLTLKELARVEQSLVKSLCAIYHGRIVYPKAAEAPRPSEAKSSESKPVATQTA